jgi:pyroglutamyl-peptidase
MRARHLLLSLVLALTGCSASDGGDEPIPGAILPRDSAPDGLFRDFLDGKYDGAGHPLDSEVWQAEQGCSATTGNLEAEGRAFRPEKHLSGSVCKATSKTVGLGRFVLNVRALAYTSCSGSACELPALELIAKNADDSVIESKTVAWSAFGTSLTYSNLALAFSHSVDGPMKIEVNWPDKVALRVDYVELFRSSRRLLVSPPSGLLPAGASFVIEALDPPQGFTLSARCDEIDLSAALQTLLASGEATREDTEFRSTFTVPADKLMAGCTLPSRVRFSLEQGNWTQATSRVTIFGEEPPCTFDSGATRVLLTGFEPFPASSTHDNSSEQAVQAFDPAAVAGISLMTLTLPVEFDAAPGIVQSAIERCAPDVVVGFGQGRDRVDIETTAYNRKDSAEVAGGVPDNRGTIPGGEPIVAGGPAEMTTGLPAEAIVAALGQSQIEAGLSDDPGRYVCNNVFYRIMTESQSTKRVGGFVHLPYIHTVSDADRAMLKTVVTRVVTAAVEKQRAL